MQIGLTMKAAVNVRDGSGVRLPQLASNNAAYTTDVFRSTDVSADARVQAIIAANESTGAVSPGVEHRDGDRKLAQGPSTDRLASAQKAQRPRVTPVALQLSPAAAVGGGGRFQ